jgi:hypothetical protein
MGKTHSCGQDMDCSQIDHHPLPLPQALILLCPTSLQKVLHPPPTYTPFGALMHALHTHPRTQDLSRSAVLPLLDPKRKLAGIDPAALAATTLGDLAALRERECARRGGPGGAGWSRPERRAWHLPASTHLPCPALRSANVDRAEAIDGKGAGGSGRGGWARWERAVAGAGSHAHLARPVFECECECECECMRMCLGPDKGFR